MKGWIFRRSVSGEDGADVSAADEATAIGEKVLLGAGDGGVFGGCEKRIKREFTGVEDGVALGGQGGVIAVDEGVEPLDLVGVAPGAAHCRPWRSRPISLGGRTGSLPREA